MKRIFFRHGLVILIGIAVILHWALLHWMADANIVTALLSGANRAITWKIILAIIFVLVRMLVILLIPGLILYRLGSAIFDKWTEHHELRTKL